MPTIKEALLAATNQLSGSESPQLDAEILMARTLKQARSFLHAWPGQYLTAEQLQQYQQLTQQRHSGVPLAYLTGEREFWSLDFKVSADTLIPRPATECLVQAALAFKPVINHQSSGFNVIDLGTGSGCIALALGHERPDWRIIAADISAKALAVARQNADALGIGNVSFIQSDWFESINEALFDLIVSNPPYIAADDPHLQSGDVRFEPQQALVAEENGLAAHQQIISSAYQKLKPGGGLLLEIGYQQADAVTALLHQQGYAEIKTLTDMEGQPRVCMARFAAEKISSVIQSRPISP